MKRSLVRNASLFARNLLLSPLTYNRNPGVSIAASTSPRLRLFSSEPDSSNKSNLTLIQKNASSIDVEDVSDQELKRRIEKFYAGDEEAVPLIFEAILKRKLAGKHDEADNKLMEEICGKMQEPLADMSDEEFDSNEEIDSDLDESSCETDEDFDEPWGAKETDMKRRVRDE